MRRLHYICSRMRLVMFYQMTETLHMKITVLPRRTLCPICLEIPTEVFENSHFPYVTFRFPYVTFRFRYVTAVFPMLWVTSGICVFMKRRFYDDKKTCACQVYSHMEQPSSRNQASRINKFIPPYMCKMDERDTKLKFESVIRISCTIVC